MSKKPNILKNIKVNEVSFVKKGANKKKFLLKKADESSETKTEIKSEEISMKETLFKVAEAVELDTKAVDEAVKKAEISEEGSEAITTVLQVLKAAEDIPVDFYPTLVTLAGGELPVTEVEVIKEVEVEVEKKSDKEKAEKLKKEALEALTADQREVMEQALSISKAAEEKATAVEAELNKEKDLRKVAVFVAKAEKEMSALPETAEVIGNLLKKSEETFTKEEATSFEKILKAAQDAIASREDFNATGTIGDGQEDSAYAAVLAKAADLRKVDTDMSLARAIAQVATDEPELYNKYRSEVN